MGRFKPVELRLRPANVYWSRDIATILGVPLRDVQTFARILKIPKDSTGLYVFSPSDLAAFQQVRKN